LTPRPKGRADTRRFFVLKKTFAMAIAGAVGVSGMAPTVAAAGPAEPPARSLEQVRAGALAAMYAGDLQEVQKRGKRFRGNRARNRSFRGGRSFRGRSWRGRSAYRRGYYGGRRYYRGRGYRRGYGGAAVAAGVIGLAAGAAIASSARSSGYRTRSWCAQRFKSYNPRTGTYLGYDGRRHACP
jgi:hypothetical protein